MSTVQQIFHTDSGFQKIPNNVMNLHFFFSSSVFKVKSICVQICIGKLLLMQDIKKVDIMKIKEICQLLTQLHI